MERRAEVGLTDWSKSFRKFFKFPRIKKQVKVNFKLPNTHILPRLEE